MLDMTVSVTKGFSKGDARRSRFRGNARPVGNMKTLKATGGARFQCLIYLLN